jgi:hypothetical protein
MGDDHKVHIYLEHHSVCLLIGIVTPSTPLRMRVCFPSEQGGGGGTHWPACEGRGESQFGRLERKPSTLSALW